MSQRKHGSSRSIVIVIVVAGLLAAPSALAVAQSRSTDVFPIRAEPKVGGVYDIHSGRMIGKTSAQALGANLQTVYNNTCTWSGGAFYAGVEACEDDYDEGRVPLVADGGAGVVGPDNAIDSVEIGYCTWFPTGSVDVDMTLFDTNQLGGACLGGIPPIGQVGLFAFDSAAAGFPLPGSSALGTQACWLVTLATLTPACLATGATAADLFNWRVRFNQQFNAQSPEGPILSHNGSAGGQGTYNIAPATDVLFGNPCGDGLGNDDSYWANYDNVPVGGSPSVLCPTAAIAGSNCYWFGGYPSNPHAGYRLVMTSRGSCVACGGGVRQYCTSKTNSLGCVPTLSTAGVPDFGTTAFTLTASQLINNKNGLWFYGTNGQSGVAFQGGHLCVNGPIKRLQVRNTDGNPPPNDCSGVLTENFNDKINGVGYPIDPALTTGAAVGAQAWSRDPSSPSTTSLSNAVCFVICPGASTGVDLGLVAETDFEDQADAPCPPGEKRWRLRAWRTKFDGQGAMSVFLKKDGNVIAEGGTAPFCIHATIYAGWTTACLKVPNPLGHVGMSYIDCDAEAGSIDVPAGGLELGCPEAVVTHPDNGQLDSMGLLGSVETWVSSNTSVLQVGNNGAWTSAGPGVAHVTRTNTWIVGSEKRVIRLTCKFRVN